MGLNIAERRADVPPAKLLAHPRPEEALGMTAAILYASTYNSTGGSLFAVVVLHGATIATPSLPPSTSSAVVLIAALYAMIAIGLLWQFGAANLSWRDKVTAPLPNESQIGPALASEATQT